MIARKSERKIVHAQPIQTSATSSRTTIKQNEMREFTNSMNFALYSALKRKKTQIVHDQIRVSTSMVAYIKVEFGLSGRYRPTDMLERMNLVTEFIATEVDLKQVFHFEARVFSKREITVVSALGKKTIVKPPSYLSFKLASENTQINKI